MKSTFLKYALLSMLVCWMSSCELLELDDINVDPNNPSEASLDLLLSQALLSGSEIFADDINQNLHSFVGIMAEQDIDGFDIDNQTYNLDWQRLYYGPLKDVQALIDIAEAQGNNPYYLGIGQLLKAYYFSTMVDLWGSVPYSEALQADYENSIKYPGYDSDEEIYNDAFRLIEEGLANLNENSVVVVENDPIYRGNIAQWIKMGKSLKLRLLMNTRLVRDNAAEIQALLEEGDLILDGADDFTFQFSNINNPENENRHPWYVEAYTGSSYGFNYMGHQFMVEMLDFEDPRRPFYIKRQTTLVLDQSNDSERQTTPCSQIQGCVYSYIVLNDEMIDRLYTSKGKTFGAEERAFLAGFFGRDRADPSGAPADGELRSAVAVYPVGGLFDDAPEAANNNKGSGAGIFPMITSEHVKFYWIEAMLELGLPGDPRALLEEVIREHIDKVIALGRELDPDGAPVSGTDTIDSYINLPLDSATEKYVAFWMQRYDNQPNKLETVVKQAWFTNYGNGFEIYNTFRRTGYPSDLQTPLNRFRQFALRLPYPQDELNFNQAVPQEVRNSAFDRDPVFWDTRVYQFE